MEEKFQKFLIEKTGSPAGYWTGRMRARDQRELFGLYLGKGTVHIDGKEKQLRHSVTVCFGCDFHITFDKSWKELTKETEK
jgi:hypothetical protein